MQNLPTIRTKEAENACKILHAKAVYVGQIDGNTILSKEKNDEIAKLISAEESGPGFYTMAHGFIRITR